VVMPLRLQRLERGHRDSAPDDLGAVALDQRGNSTAQEVTILRADVERDAPIHVGRLLPQEPSRGSLVLLGRQPPETRDEVRAVPLVERRPVDDVVEEATRSLHRADAAVAPVEGESHRSSPYPRIVERNSDPTRLRQPSSD